MNKHITCDCGCDKFWIPVTDKTPKEGMCCNCRKMFSFATADKIILGEPYKEIPE